MLEVVALHKNFGGVRALSDVSFRAGAGRVLGLIGENGAGKSTIVKCLTGIHSPTSGQILLDGAVHTFQSPQSAVSAGISAIHQEPAMFDDLSVAENICAGAIPKGFGGFVNWARMKQQAKTVLDCIGSSLSPTARLKSLSVAEQHMVSLAKALAADARVILFDEPTAALSRTEIQHLYSIIDSLKAQGKTILFISHKFDEIFRICDDYVVLRDGKLAGHGQISETSEDRLIEMMVGRAVSDIYPKAQAEIGEILLEASGLSHPTEFEDVSFQVRRGEILGFYGLVGAGRTEVMEAVFGLKQLSRGTLRVDGKDVTVDSPRRAMDAGLAYVPEDRQHHGAILPFSIAANMSLPQLEKVSRGTFLNAAAENALVDSFANKVSIRANGWTQSVSELSGGNQQKVVIGKWLATAPRVIILDEPTKGIDVGSKSAVHETIGALVQDGLAVVIASSELEEVLGIADRIIVMARGRVVAEFDRPSFSGETIVAAASGNLL